MKNTILDDEDFAFFRENGFLIKRDFLPRSFMEDANEFVDQFAKTKVEEWFAAGLLKEAALGKFSNYRESFIDIWQLAGMPKYSRQIHHYSIHPSMYKLLNDETLLKAVKKLLAAERVYAGGTQNYRVKSGLLPWAVLDWHVDRYYWEEHEDPDFEFLICWFPLQDMIDDGGGVEVIPLSERSGYDLRHQRKDVNIPSALLEGMESIKARLNTGDMLFFNSRVIHRSITYKHLQPFWSIDLRYESEDYPSTDTQKYGFLVDGGSRKTLNTWLKKKEPKNQPV